MFFGFLTVTIPNLIKYNQDNPSDNFNFIQNSDPDYEKKRNNMKFHSCKQEN